MSRADALLDRLGDGLIALSARAAWLRRWYVPVTAAGLTVLAVVAVFRIESTAPNYDPQYMRVLVERTMQRGGSYYSNGIHNKGPLEPLVYEVAGRLGGRDGWWFLIAVVVLAVSLCVGLAAAVLAIRAGGSTLLGVCVAVMAVVHLTISDADYAGVLYARNLTTGLLAGAIGVAAYAPWWAAEHHRRRAVVAVGVAVGLAVQTLVTAVFTAVPVFVWAMWSHRRSRVWGRPAWLVIPGVAAAAGASAPLYYLTLGPWQDFVDGFWTHARLMSSGTGRDLGSQLGLGREQFVAYYADRPELVIALVACLLVVMVRFRSMSVSVRTLHLAVACWWVGAWVELVLSQRYSSHYFSVLAVPTILVIALAVGGVAPAIAPVIRNRPAFALLPLLVAHVTIGVGGTTSFDLGVDAASEVRSTQDFTDRREVGLDGRVRLVRATLDLVSQDGDPLLVWTSYPWPYLDLRRTSATRYIWKTFLLGEIYLGGSGPQYVLPGTWEHFADDLDAADPVAYYVESVNPIDPSTPFRAAVDARFVDVFGDDAVTLGLRRDVVTWLTTPAADGLRIAPLDETPFSASPDGCVRLDGRLSAQAAPVVVALTGGNGEPATLAASIEAGTLVVESRPSGVAGWLSATPAAGEPLPFSLVVGERAAVLVVDGRVAGAVEVEPGTAVTLTSGIADLTAAGATLSTPPPITGC